MKTLNFWRKKMTENLSIRKEKIEYFIKQKYAGCRFIDIELDELMMDAKRWKTLNFLTTPEKIITPRKLKKDILNTFGLFIDNPNNIDVKINIDSDILIKINQIEIRIEK